MTESHLSSIRVVCQHSLSQCLTVSPQRRSPDLGLDVGTGWLCEEFDAAGVALNCLLSTRLLMPPAWCA